MILAFGSIWWLPLLVALRPERVCFIICLSALPIKPLAPSDYVTSTSLTPKGLYLLLDLYVSGKSGLLIYSMCLVRKYGDLNFQAFHQKFTLSLFQHTRRHYADSLTLPITSSCDAVAVVCQTDFMVCNSLGEMIAIKVNGRSKLPLKCVKMCFEM